MRSLKLLHTCKQTNLFFLIYQSYSLRSSSTSQGHIFCNYKDQKKKKSNNNSVHLAILVLHVVHLYVVHACHTILTFWLVLAYDLLEDRHTDDISSMHFCFFNAKQVDSMLPCFCSVIDHRGHQNVIKTSVTDSPYHIFWRHLWSITEQTHHNMDIYLLNCDHPGIGTVVPKHDCCWLWQLE